MPSVRGRLKADTPCTVVSHSRSCPCPPAPLVPILDILAMFYVTSGRKSESPCVRGVARGHKDTLSSTSCGTGSRDELCDHHFPVPAVRLALAAQVFARPSFSSIPDHCRSRARALRCAAAERRLSARALLACASRAVRGQLSELAQIELNPCRTRPAECLPTSS